MQLLSALAAFLAATSMSIASPVKARSPDVVQVEVCETETDFEVVTVTAAPVTVVQDVVVTEAPAVVFVTETVHWIAQAPPAGPGLVSAAEPTTVMSVTQKKQATYGTDHSQIVQANSKPPPPPPAATSSSAFVAPPPSSSSSPPASQAPPPPLSTPLEPSSSDAGLPTNTIDYNLKPSDPIYTGLVLYSHNVHRENHTNTHDLVYNTTLQAFAKEKAESCQWNEDLSDDATAANVGMNMAEGTFIGAANITAIVSDMWYNGEIDIFPAYDESSPDMSKFDLWGHFTQVIWRDTTSVGCWSAACARNDGATNEIGAGYFTVCTYYPPANIPGEYADQIGKPLGHAVVDGA